MAARDVDILLAEHYGAQSGPEGRQFLGKAMAAAAETRRSLEETYAETDDVAQTTEIITDRIMADAPKDFLPREVVAIVAGQMVNFIAKTKSSAGHAEK
jgi:hypothetical protein